MPHCIENARIAYGKIINSEPFEFKSECLTDIIIYAIYRGEKEWNQNGNVSWLKKLKRLTKLLSNKEKEYIAFQTWKLNRKYYDYISKELNIKASLENIHR